ncbi:C-terminal processing protease CtpA/Prc [Pedobacter cryoconitis]|uniref:C-terminal processing protease CtpA/Prc n=1 Tax=Pedobacter cryoconitis TaxID=188932 RepID=A0A7W8ZIU0_9SPHI|nr:S41 family peptidase [Pedobacter cryoconitis]MBB5634781.1 C-terminal processing protease CtpA/Prc [Pedobacter cryoconitis]
MKTCSLFIKTLLLYLMIFSLYSCKKSDNRPDYPAGSQENINSWILDSMKVYYYWNAGLPGNPVLNTDPSSFFKSIKNSADRFSALVNPDLPESYPPSLVHTLGFDWITLQTSDGQVKTMISLVVPGSRAAGKGLVRGDIIQTINGTVPTAANIASLTNNSILKQSTDLELVGKTGIIQVQRLINSEDPVYTYHVFQSGGKTYGYLFLNSFENTALSQLKRAFAYFKQEQVQELILDMRYNPGGSVPVAAALAVMIAQNTTEAATFVEYRGNQKAGVRKSSFGAELSKLPSGLNIGFAGFSGYRLNLNKIYVLTGNHTASAAELLINSLRPYITVVHSGQQTLGKDMAGFVIKDYRNPQIVPKWEIYPMIFKLYNAAGRGDYSNGLTPDQITDELTVLPLKPFGDLSDPLIQSCLQKTNMVAGQNRVESTLERPRVIFDSRVPVDLKTGLTISRPY